MWRSFFASPLQTYFLLPRFSHPNLALYSETTHPCVVQTKRIAHTHLFGFLTLRSFFFVLFQSVEDQRHLRDLVTASDGIAFVADGSVLPRRSGSDDRPMARGAVPFASPESLRREFRLPHRGVVKGMLVPRGVTVIVGGGYHGGLRV